MAASGTRRSAERSRAHAAGAAPTLAVAASGGRDSTALLHATLARARGLGLQVVALHVHHGLQPEADAWLLHLQRQCRRWAARGAPLRFVACRLQGRPGLGDSIEAWARRERYAALARMAHGAGAGAVLLAHHAQDQAETFLLQALRGAGPAGLASMPRAVQREGLLWLRPWLAQRPETIAAYVRRHRLSHIEDASNRDLAFARNRLRAQVMPALSEAFTGAQEALCAAAQRAQEAQACLADIAQSDLQQVADGNALRVSRWQALPPPRQLNALRHWLRVQLGQGAAETLVQRLLRELARPGNARWPAGAMELRRYRDRLQCAPPVPAAPMPAVTALSLPGAGVFALAPWPGTLHLKRVRSGGVALARLQHCELRSRAGSEQFQCAPGATPRSLKKQFQAAGVAPWCRDGPLLYGAGQLLYVPGLGIDARAIAPSGEPQVSLAWRREPGP
jgi:tRNA(Ile)-lysidine synthase